MGLSSCHQVEQDPQSSASKAAQSKASGKASELPTETYSQAKQTAGGAQASDAFRTNGSGSGTSESLARAEAFARVPEPPEIVRLRAELKVKESALDALRKEANNHLALIEALEREAFQKDEAIRDLRSSEEASKEVAGLLAEIRQKDMDIDDLRLKANNQESTLKTLADEAQAKGDAVENLVSAITEQCKVGSSPEQTTKAAVATAVQNLGDADKDSDSSPCSKPQQYDDAHLLAVSQRLEGKLLEEDAQVRLQDNATADADSNKVL